MLTHRARPAVALRPCWASAVTNRPLAAHLVEWLGRTACSIPAAAPTGWPSSWLAGAEVVGVNLNPAVLAAARRKGPEVEWGEGRLGRRWRRDLGAVVMADNVMISSLGTEAVVLANVASPPGLAGS